MKNLTVHKNTVDKKRRRAMKDDFMQAGAEMFSRESVAAYAVIALDEEGRAMSFWDTGGVVPMWCFPGLAYRVMDFEMAECADSEDYKKPFAQTPFKRSQKMGE